MPKRSNHPRLRVHVKRGKNGQVWTSYWFDNRGTGRPDVPLGNDREQALKRWDELFNHKPRIAGTLEEAFEAWERDVLPNYANATTRRNYGQNLRQLRPVFGHATWDQVTLPTLKTYLRKRSAKTQANREMALLSIIWNWSRGEGLTELPWPAHGMGKSRWKNTEDPRQIEVSDAIFEAVYKHSDSLLRQALDVATATGLRVRDVVGLRVSDVREGRLVVSASKTGKRVEFDLAASEVLPRLLEARKASKAPHLFVLTCGKKVVTERMLAERFKQAREAAAKEVPECAGLILRDMRKRAGQLAGSVEEASKLLQHSSMAVTRKHYVQGEKVRPVR